MKHKKQTEMILGERLERLVSVAEKLLEHYAIPQNDWTAYAYRWRKRPFFSMSIGTLQPIHHPHAIQLDDLVNIDEQKMMLDENTRRFIEGFPANNVLLTGARGTGKSSLVKAMLTKYAKDGLRLIEVEREDMADLPDIVVMIENRPEHFILFCDDLSFEDNDPGYKALKVLLDGSLSSLENHLLIYATSNRRHLVPEYFEDNTRTQYKDGEIHPADAIEEKISLSERFGLWLSFYAFTQDEYLEAVTRWLTNFGLNPTIIESAKPEALQWALRRGARNGRIAWQFSKHYISAFNRRKS